ncbi:MAG: alanine:cation symporter family protein [Peptococcaceae bacterium]|jgi:AGCS family alanine or glycine:cation symporter|nr:alanine:cation symporter family protein [Peptococcaceae bacterium]MBQ2013568.1 alanine:cation symporter family protein [Peptococcaceae bacterium]MBQ2119578.1 alanine:cation symporter family protein [Peptococcaceae bacterium]MBQ5857750.1 alanine:cation symporter family protein [Peptococcaceae bacterium]
MEVFASIVSTISGWLYGYILIALLILAGLYFTIRTGFIQFRLLGESIRVIKEPRKDRNAISSFQALMVSTASRVGTGNIVGVTGAIIAGGPGAVFWMWVIALVGGASAFVESTLAQIYKKRGENGSYGGPAYYIKQALHSPALGGAFAVALILTYMGGFNALASYNMTDFVKAYLPGENATVVIGAVIAVLAALVILGGGKRISKVTQIVVPFMAMLYILVALTVVVMNIENLPIVFKMIFSEAFNPQSAFGGLMGAAMMNGIKRGLYSNEAGIGSAPNAAASADVSHPVKQGLVQMLSVFLDTLVICTATAFMILCTSLDPALYIDAAGNTMNAAYIQDSLVANFGAFGSFFITAALALFAYTTLIGNYYYAEMNISYLYKGAQSNKTFMFCYRLLAVVIIFIGAQFSAGLAWDLADVLMGFMALINVPVCLILGGTAFKALDDYIRQRREGKDPVFKAADIGIHDTEYWN